MTFFRNGSVPMMCVPMTLPRILSPFIAVSDSELPTYHFAEAPVPASEKLREGAERLGWSSREMPRWVRPVESAA